MNAKEGVRRLAIALGVVGLVFGCIFGYRDAQILWQAHSAHKRFESLMVQPAVQKVARDAAEKLHNDSGEYRYYGERWAYREINDVANGIKGVEVDTATWTISEIDLLNGGAVRDDIDRPFYVYIGLLFYPALGFLILWAVVHGVAWVLAGFSNQTTVQK